MENAAKALSIAGGILIALIILAGLIYTFQKMSEIPDRQNYIKEVQEIEEFNRQFEAYQKKLMYGVDVISCLNKVIDNNEKSREYANGEYDVIISVEIKSDLRDSVRVYYYKEDGKDKWKEDIKLGSTNIYFKDIFTNNEINEESKISNIKRNTEVISNSDDKSYVSKITKGTYTNDESDNNKFSILKDLSLSTVDMQKVATNPNKDDIKNWSKVVWYTSAYNFKNKKFRCTNISYSTEGRVNKISFEEVLNNN